jgi:hypothetical protein
MTNPSVHLLHCVLISPAKDTKVHEETLPRLPSGACVPFVVDRSSAGRAAEVFLFLHGFLHSHAIQDRKGSKSAAAKKHSKSTTRFPYRFVLAEQSSETGVRSLVWPLVVTVSGICNASGSNNPRTAGVVPKLLSTIR